MSNVYPLVKEGAVFDEASLWIARLDRALSHEEEQALKQWLAASPRHREVFIEMAQLWDRMDSLSRLSSLFPAQAQRNHGRNLRVYFAAAASFLLAFVSLWFINATMPDALPEWMAWHRVELVDGVYETGVGEHSTVNLPDGSQLVLNTNSLVKINYSGTARTFFLERGELHINVAHDSSRPLSVLAGKQVVQAVGTAFNVQLSVGDEVELIVTEGRVLVSERSDPVRKESIPEPLGDSSIAISQGEKLVLGAARTAEVTKIAVNDIEASLSWRQGNLVFRGETLEEALLEIGRYTEVEFDVVDDTIKSVRIAGLFKAGDVNGLLSTLEKNFQIDHRRVSSDRVLLSRL